MDWLDEWFEIIKPWDPSVVYSMDSLGYILRECLYRYGMADNMSCDTTGWHEKKSIIKD